jgi:salicylate hydroxylase
MTEKLKANVMVIGGGIGGMATALSLQRRGFPVQVYERAKVIREVGAGVVITANARRALRDLGVDAQLEAMSSTIDIFYTCHYATGEVLRAVSKEDISRKVGIASLGVYRADLHSVLMQAVLANDPDCLHAQSEFASLTQDATGVTVQFVNGTSARADVVVGADGNASAVRSFLFPQEAPKFAGQIAFRSLIPMDLVPPSVRQRGSIMSAGPGRYLLSYPLRGGQLMNLIGLVQSGTWEEEGWTTPATKEEFAQAFVGFESDLLALIDRIPEGEVFKWGLRDREPLQNWTVGRVTMLGDAAHPMTPFLGQGACMAIEDGLILGRAFADASTLSEALTRYEQARKPRGTMVQLASREEGQTLQDPSKKRRTAQDRGLMDYDPVSVAV